VDFDLVPHPDHEQVMIMYGFPLIWVRSHGHSPKAWERLSKSDSNTMSSQNPKIMLIRCWGYNPTQLSAQLAILCKWGRCVE
jgi:hypothetical protein